MFAALMAGAKAMGLRFSLTGLLPFSLLTVYFFALHAIAAAAPGRGVIDAVTTSATDVGVTGLVLLFIVAILLAVVSQPFQIAVVRLLEGYWGASDLANRARDFGIELQRRRRHLLLVRRVNLEHAGREAAADYVNQLLARYPVSPERYLPTLLGNTLRAGEESAGGRYSLETTVSWPRLYYCLPDNMQRDVSDLHQQVDGGARLSLATAVAGVAGLPVLLHHGWWNVVWVALLLLAVVAYRGTVIVASMLRAVYESAYDLHRFDLLAALHLDVPDNPEDERKSNSWLTLFWSGQKPSPVPDGAVYVHPKNDDDSGGPAAKDNETLP